MKLTFLTSRRISALFAVALLSCGVAQADTATTGDGNLPWDGPLKLLEASLTGTAAKAIGIVAIAAAGGMLAFGGELSEFTRRILMVVLGLAVLLEAKTVLSGLFGLTL
jgi:type IV secretion system protein TrbC